MVMISEAYPSNYLKAADLRGTTVRATISNVEMEKLGNDTRPVVYFQNKEKGLVLNKTNANNISLVYGDDTDDWIGKAIQLYPTMTDYQGRSVECIRVKPVQGGRMPAPPTHRPNKATQEPPPVQSTEDYGAQLDDEIPF
jgi:hypothetical protein